MSSGIYQFLSFGICVRVRQIPEFKYAFFLEVRIYLVGSATVPEIPCIERIERCGVAGLAVLVGILQGSLPFGHTSCSSSVWTQAPSFLLSFPVPVRSESVDGEGFHVVDLLCCTDPRNEESMKVSLRTPS